VPAGGAGDGTVRSNQYTNRSIDKLQSAAILPLGKAGRKIEPKFSLLKPGKSKQGTANVQRSEREILE